MTVNGLISQALGLQISSYTLKVKYENVMPVDIERKSLILAGLWQSSSILLSFAIEIALKGLLKFRFDNFPRTHNLKRLYEKLDEEDRLKISTIYKQKTNSEINECIERHKDMFIEFRYLELETKERYENTKVNAVLESIIEHYNSIKK